MDICMFCRKKEGKVFFNFNAVEPIANGINISHTSNVCYSCLKKVFESLIEIINKQNGVLGEKNTILPSIPWARRQRMGKISNDELLDIKLWLKKIKNLKDFKEDK